LCTGAKRPVLRNDENLKLHYLFAHSNHFFGKTLKVSSEIETQIIKAAHYRVISEIYREIAPRFSVVNSKQEFWALLITKRGVRGDGGSEK
jgi:hypothetical protein